MFSGGTSQPKNENISIGKLGEDLACEYLVKNGYGVLKRNCRQNWGEIDIVCKAKDGTLVFYEVKTLNGDEAALACLTPEDNLTASKLKKLRRTCEIFASKNPELVDDGAGWQIDLLAIVLTGPGQARGYVVRHYENI